MWATLVKMPHLTSPGLGLEPSEWLKLLMHRQANIPQVRIILECKGEIFHFPVMSYELLRNSLLSLHLGLMNGLGYSYVK